MNRRQLLAALAASPLLSGFAEPVIPTPSATPDALANDIAILRRALALTKADVPSIKTLEFKPDGRLEGLDVLVADATTGGPEAAVALAAHLLGLLVTFVGEPVTLRLVRDAWPDAVWNKIVNNRGGA